MFSYFLKSLGGDGNNTLQSFFRLPCHLSIYEYIFTLHVKKNTNKITQSPDTNIVESIWEYEITRIDEKVNKTK